MNIYEQKDWQLTRSLKCLRKKNQNKKTPNWNKYKSDSKA